MSTIEIKVTGRELSFINMPTISAGAVGADSIKFEFESPSVWDGYIKYCVVFKNRSQYCPEALDNSNIAQISSNMLSNEGILYIGLCGYKDATRLTSTIVSYEIKNGVYCIHSSEEEELAKTKFEQILEYYDATLREQQAINERLDEIEKAPFNVKLFGARGNGIDDDAGAIQSAINAARDAGGGTVFFPSGTYYFSHTVTFASNIKLQGDINTVFTADKISGDYPKRTSNFLEIGSLGGNSVTEYNGFSNVEINNIIFDLGGQWSLNGDVLTYKAKYDSSSPTGSFRGFYSYCPIVACHGDGLRVINCTFKNGIYGGYTGNGGTNPHIMDLGGVKNILIEGCTFEPIFATTTGISNWMGINGSDTGSPDPTNFELIQLDACYGDGGTSGIKGKFDGTICRDVIIRNNKFYGLPDYDWKKVVNNTGDNDQLLIKPNITVSTNAASAIYDINYSQWRFGKYAAIGTCHEFKNSNYQPQNVEIYDNYFEGSWNSHYCGSKPCINEAFNAAIEANHKDVQGRLYPIINEKWEPARKFCNGAIYAYPGARGYNVHNNTFKETTPYTENKSTAVFLYSSLAGTVHDNIFIEYGEPLPRGKKEESMSGFTFEAGDAWSSSKTGYYDGVAYCKSSNNIWIKNGELSEELDCLGKVQDINFAPIENSDDTTAGYTLSFTKTNGTGAFSVMHGKDGTSPTIKLTGLVSNDPDIRDGTQVTITDVNGTDSFQVYDGKSAYEIALDSGFEGSKEEWLESLHGDGADFMGTEFTDDDQGKFVHIGTDRKPELVNLLGARWEIGTGGLDFTSIVGRTWFMDRVRRALCDAGMVFDVVRYGAIGNGQTDDGWAIQTAIDECHAIGGGTIHFPAGIYNITRTLFYYSNMTFKFEKGAMIRKMTDTDHGSSNPSAIFAPYFETEIALLNNGKGTSGFASNRYAVENVVFEGGTISGYSWNGSSVNTSPSSVVLLTCLCRNIKFYNMTFDGNSGGHSIEINSSTDVTVRDCRFTGFVSSPGLMNPTNSSLRDWSNAGGMYTENIQIDAATAGAIASQLRITKGDESYKAPNGKIYDVWYKYTRDTSLNYRAIGGYFDFTLLPPGDQYNIHQDAIGEKLSYLNKDNTPLTQDQIKGMPGFHQCCHNIEIASCYFENNQDTEGGTWTWVPPTSGQNNGHWASLPNTCFVSAIGCHTSFRAINESHANEAHDKHSGIKIHDNTFIWPTNHYHGGTANDSSYWRGVIAFGTNESVNSNKAFEDVHIYNVSIHGNMFYRNKDCLIDETQPKIGYAITTIRDDTRYTRENVNVPQSKYKIYGNFYAGINGWENGTSSEIYQEGSTLVITDGISMPVKSGENLMFY